jgi:hypothetical protein
MGSCLFGQFQPPALLYDCLEFACLNKGATERFLFPSQLLQVPCTEGQLLPVFCQSLDLQTFIRR